MTGGWSRSARREDIYQSPRSIFVADFVGSTNVLRGVVCGADTAAGTVSIEVDDAGIVSVAHAAPLAIGRTVGVAVKPERVSLGTGPSGGGAGSAPEACRGEVESSAYLGSGYSYMVKVGAQRVEARCADAVLIDGRPVRAGDRIGVTLDRESTRIFDA